MATQSGGSISDPTKEEKWWREGDLNSRPNDYESFALTN